MESVRNKRGKPQVLSKCALLYWIGWAVLLLILRMTVLSGIPEDFYPSIFFISLVLYLPGLILIGMDAARYYDYMETSHRDFVED